MDNRTETLLDVIEAGPGVYSTTGGIVDLGSAERADEGSVEVAPGLVVENPPADPQELAERLSGALGLDPRKGRRR